MLTEERTQVSRLGSALQRASRRTPNSLPIRMAVRQLNAQRQPKLGFTHRFHFIPRLLLHSHVLRVFCGPAQDVTWPAGRSSSSRK